MSDAHDRTAKELIREAQMHKLSHSNIVKLLAVVFELGHYGIVMERVRFGALDEFVARYYEKARHFQLS